MTFQEVEEVRRLPARPRIRSRASREAPFDDAGNVPCRRTILPSGLWVSYSLTVHLADPDTCTDG